MICVKVCGNVENYIDLYYNMAYNKGGVLAKDKRKEDNMEITRDTTLGELLDVLEDMNWHTEGVLIEAIVKGE